MGGSRALTIVLATGLGLMMALGAPAETAPPPAEQQSQPRRQPQAPERVLPAAKVPPVQYLKAGATLFNKGDVAQATRYFDAAERFRAELSENEQIVLDVYQEEVEKYQKRLAAPRSDPAVAPASMRAQAPAGAAMAPEAQPNSESPSASLRTLTPSRYDTTTPKQRARWLIQEAREQMQLGHLDEAARKLAEAEAMNAKWGRLEDSPAKLAKVLDRVRAKAPAGSSSSPSARPLGLHAIGVSPAQP
jgi:hypothetical protein